MLVDDVKLKVEAGKGGDGSNAFLSISGNPKQYSDGGDGGRGGNVYFQASNNVSDLSEFRYKKEIKAGDGQMGMRKNWTGADGLDVTILLPFGTKITDEDTGETIELLDDKPFLIARGGSKGEGSHNYNPDVDHFEPQHKEGGFGQRKNLHLVLSLIADVGLIGFPNAGKSSLLSVLTNANPKVANYAFTTLEPNLGVYEKIVIADIPGLIEGASKGVGLGLSFLKHIEKTKVLLHCIDSQSKDPMKDYKTVRKEFEQYKTTLLQKDEIVLVTKTDLVTEEQLQEIIKTLQKTKREVMPVSIYIQEHLDKLKMKLDQLA